MPDAEARPTVVVANTDATVCEVLARVVESGGAEAVRVTDPSLITGAVLSAPAEAVVLDLGADNVEHLRALRASDAPRASEVRALVVSTGPANSLLAWQAGADAVLTRPFAAAEVPAALTAALGRSEAERTAVRRAEASTLAS